MEAAMRDDGPGVLQAASETISRATELVQIELRVFRAELAEKAAKVRTGLGFVLAGAVLVTAALFLILQAVVLQLVQAGMSPAAATLLVAAACIAIGFLLVMSGRKKIEADHLVPQRTIDDVERDSTLVKEKLT
jgi:uncharacterized membrane protein YqjE